MVNQLKLFYIWPNVRDKCDDGYGFSKEDENQRKCVKCSDFCENCDYDNRCIYCKEGYTTGTDENCPKYSYINLCSECDAGYCRIEIDCS